MGTKSLLAVIVLIIVSAASGFLVGQASKSTKTPGNVVQTIVKPEAPKAQNIFNTQTATIQGKIAEVSGSSVSVTSDKGQTAKFTLSPKVVIYKFAPGSSQSTATQDIKSIETDKNVLVTLELMNGQYQVTQIAFLPPSPPPPAK